MIRKDTKKQTKTQKQKKRLLLENLVCLFGLSRQEEVIRGEDIQLTTSHQIFGS